MKDYKEQCQAKWKELESIIGFESDKGDSGKRFFYNKDLTKNNLEISLQIEYDENEFYTGIIYGIRAKEEIHSTLDKVLKINRIKNLYYECYWKYKETLSKRTLDIVFLRGEPHKSKAEKENSEYYYWPLWIRLEEKYPTVEALFGSLVLLKALEQQGWTIKNI